MLKVGMRLAALAQPLWAISGQECLPKEQRQRAKITTLAIVLVPVLEDVLDMLGVADKMGDPAADLQATHAAEAKGGFEGKSRRIAPQPGH